MSTADAVDVGRMLAWASRPRDMPGRHEDYHRLVARYHDDPDFAATVDSVFAGAGLAVIVDPREGVLVTAEADSSLRVDVSDIMKRAQPQQRAVIGAVLLAVARTAYPDTALVDDPDRVAVFTAQSVVDTLDRAAARHAEANHDDSDVDDNLVEGWRQWLALAEARPNARRRSANDRLGLVNRVCRFLAEAGYLTARGDTGGGTWLARTRFRLAVAALCEDSELYLMVNGLDVNSSSPDYRAGSDGHVDSGGSSTEHGSSA